MSATQTIAQTQPSATTTLRASKQQGGDDSLPQVQASIHYLDRSVAKPYQYLCTPPPGEPENNFKRVETPVRITDLSSTTAEQRAAQGFNTENAGFEFVRGFGKAETQEEWAAEKWEEDEWMKKNYYADVDALLKKQLGVTSTFIFDHTIRKSQTAHLPDDPANRKPVSQAHCDQSRWAGENRIQKHLGTDMLERVKKGEVHAQLINVWRPLRGPVEEHPLAVADSRTVGQPGSELEDWITSELRYEDWTGETLAIYPNPAHRWYYYKGIDTDQAIFLKCYDSKTETRTPHTAFVDPTTKSDAKPRWSVEVRVLTFTEQQKSE